MANTLGISFAADAGEMIADIPSTLVWSSQSITGTSGEWVRSIDEDERGILDVLECSWMGKVSGFTDSTLPPPRTKVTIDGTRAYITDRAENIDGDVVRFQLRRLENT